MVSIGSSRKGDWAKVLDELEHSGMSVEAFAKKIRCSKTTLYHYKNQRAAASKLRVSKGEVLSLQLTFRTHLHLNKDLRQRAP